MKLLFTSDIHQMDSKWKKLVQISQKEKPDIIGIAGDILPKQNGILSQMPFISHLKKYAKNIRNNTSAKLLMILGNDDNQLMIPEMEKEHENLWFYIPEKVVTIKGYEFAGMPFVPDYPFGYKYWCAPDSKDNFRIDQCYNPVLINEYNRFEQIPSMTKYFESKKSIWDSLKETSEKVKDIHKSIWMIHAPPSKCNLDACASGYKVGSDAVLKFIEEYQPLITVHGHIHESPEYTGKTWYNKVGNTICIQGGQLGFDVHYTIVEIEDGRIISVKHSIYGEAAL